jgi:hypothetical protein
MTCRDIFLYYLSLDLLAKLKNQTICSEFFTVHDTQESLRLHVLIYKAITLQWVCGTLSKINFEPLKQKSFNIVAQGGGGVDIFTVEI